MRACYARVWLPPAITKVNRRPRNKAGSDKAGLTRRWRLGVFRRSQPYCCGVTVPSQVGITAALERTTASPNEQ